MNEAILAAAIAKALNPSPVKATEVTGVLCRKPPSAHAAGDCLKVTVQPGAPLLVLRRILESSTVRTIEHTALLVGDNYVSREHPELLAGVLPEAFDQWAHLITVSDCGPTERQSPEATYCVTNKSGNPLHMGAGSILPGTPLAKMIIKETRLSECLAAIRNSLKLGYIDCVSVGGDELARLRTLPGPPEPEPRTDLEREIAAANRNRE